ncbi:transferase family protein [Paecilomyces variotii No. 5]|uniref:Transferase family protein n=1 Tax=Byssochlamys spectabilis (strain No. 5 / NBRC 109023) TaxID=1356009 RepID=V5HT01_BYSSN|nr:transferase family protein [Paecilomyces variotii No. 5]
MKKIKSITTNLQRVHPYSLDIGTTTPLRFCQPLSLCDSKCVNYYTSGGTWFFNPSPRLQSIDLITEHLRKTLSSTLDFYPQWAGELRQKDVNHSKDIRGKYGRLEFAYGTHNDPGVIFESAYTPEAISDIVPSLDRRIVERPIWRRNQLLSDFFAPTDQPANPTSCSTIAPSVAIKVTTCADGGFIVGFRLNHSVADGSTIMRFMNDWANVSRAVLERRLIPGASPIFRPEQVDGHAGNIESSTPNAELLTLANTLPMAQFDTWLPPPGSDRFLVPAELEDVSEAYQPAGEPFPWSDLDPSVRCVFTTIHLRPRHIENICNTARRGLSTRLSRNDLLLAHIWRSINRARGIDSDDRLTHAYIGVGIRSRLSPPLPGALVGSPVLMADVAMSGNAMNASSIAEIATNVRSTISKFDGKTIGAELHRTAYQLSPYRIANAFVGRRQIIATSVTSLNPYQPDFGISGTPRYVELDLPASNGIVLFESAPSVRPDRHPFAPFSNGVDITVVLAEEEMDRLLKDPLLRPESDLS